MEQYINKADVVAEIERIKKEECPTDLYEGICKLFWFERFLTFINTLEVKEVDNKNDNTKPKFKEGDWIIFDGLILHIDEIVHSYYRTTSIGGIPNSYDWDIDSIARPWTIQEAKDGDVLIASDESIFIYSGSTYRYAKFYVALTKYGRLNIDGGNWEYKNSVLHPATKEQHDLLFSKIKEAGYEWDADKKEIV